MRILVTGGLGFVGSAVAAAALGTGHEVTILDDLSAGKPDVARRIKNVAGRKPDLYTGDVRDPTALNEVLSGGVNAVVHCAGKKSVTQSLAHPLAYYDANVGGTLRLLQAMQRNAVQRIIFSSSATVYGTPHHLPITESAPTGMALTNPYGRTKHVAELLLQDAAAANDTLEVTILRYFNPIGAHPSGLLGEDPAASPTNVFPLIAEVARGHREHLVVTGTDYPTPDGTGIRDYIHITDLATGHIAALEQSMAGCRVFNLGTGIGTSVRELVEAYEHASGARIRTVTGPRRNGDIARCYADPSKALHELGWSATRTVAEACAHSWAWQREIGRNLDQPGPGSSCRADSTPAEQVR